MAAVEVRGNRVLLGMLFALQVFEMRLMDS